MSQTKKVLNTLLAGVVATGLTACGSSAASKPNDPDCRDYKWDSDIDAYSCDDRSSARYGGYYYGGNYYNNKSAMINSNEYKSAASNKSSGFGSGSKGAFGG